MLDRLAAAAAAKDAVVDAAWREQLDDVNARLGRPLQQQNFPSVASACGTLAAARRRVLESTDAMLADAELDARVYARVYARAPCGTLMQRLYRKQECEALVRVMRLKAAVVKSIRATRWTTSCPPLPHM